MYLNKRQFSYVNGEKLKNRFHPDNAEHGGYSTMDDYRIESVTSGPRGVFDPTDKHLEDAENLTHAVRIIREHRSTGDEPQQPRTPIGLPPTGALAKKMGKG